METRVESLIKARIRQFGPMDVGAYMQEVLGHYYATRDPLGAAGDFTTAPEISQLFGEMIGLCLADTWLRAGSPAFHLVECGPGRGTLMGDILRATKHVPGFHAGLSLHLVETSPALRAVQNNTLKDYTVQWHDLVGTIPEDAPLIIVANEFLDALPIRQAVMTEAGWQERVIGLQDDALCFGLRALPGVNEAGKPGDVLEFSPVREAVVAEIAQRIAAQGGIFLTADYGHETLLPRGDTFQAVYKHTPCSALEHVGDADLTSHVDFARVKAIARESGCAVYGSVTQGAFLTALGIEVRLEQLAGKAPDLRSAVTRLTAPEQMGALFRVMAFTGGTFSYPPGF